MPEPDPQHAVPADDEALDLLARGELTVLGRVVEASNATLLAAVTLGDRQVPCVYKPVRGERPLWDFPTGTLARRERAAFLLSRVLGWPLVPPTVLRDGPLGPGSVQWWIGPSPVRLPDGDPDPADDEADDGAEAAAESESEPEPEPEPGAGLIDLLAPEAVPEGWLRIVEAESYDGTPVVLAHADHPQLRRLAVLDAVGNNADRKGGHVVQDRDGAVFGIDHGLTFNAEDKLRTVLWGWAGRRLPEEILTDLAALDAALTRADRARPRAAVPLPDADPDGAPEAQLATLLAESEWEATRRRVRELLTRRRHPRPGPGRPPLPWPAF